jgi:hypothetical protein
MDWVKVVIPLIAVAVWILSNLANQQKETKRPTRLPPARPPLPRDPIDSLASGPRTKAEQDDKYREELDRKRDKKPGEKKSYPRPRPKRFESLPKPPPLPVVLAPLSAPAIPPRQDKDLPNKAALGLFLPVPASVPAESIPQTGVAAPAVSQLRDLLKRRETITTAFLLKEVLDLPLAKRRRRRM